MSAPAPSTGRLGGGVLVQKIDTTAADPLGILRAAFNSSQYDGTQPHAATRTKSALPCDVSSLLPAGLIVNRSVSSEHGESILARGSGVTAMVELLGASLVVAVCARSREEAVELAEAISARAPDRVPTERSKLTYWHRSSTGGSVARLRYIDAPAWREISSNYSAGVAAAMDRLVALDPDDLSAKLILWHGQPGTGKTTAIRALIHAWRGWCQAHLVIDPERMFNEVGYLTDVLAGGRDDSGAPDLRLKRILGLVGESRTDPWQLVIAEDCDDFLRGSARREASAALSRLLNLSDGLLGQGAKTLVLLTTNQPLDRLDPALIRPGRCLAEVEFSTLSAEQSAEWLGPDQSPPLKPMTIAELYQLRQGVVRVESRVERAGIGGTYI